MSTRPGKTPFSQVQGPKALPQLRTYKGTHSSAFWDYSKRTSSESITA